MLRRSEQGAVWLVFFLFLAAQIFFSRSVMTLREGIEEMPFPLSGTALKPLSLGDEQFLFRVLALWLEGVGDGGGRVRPLVDYDYDRVVTWLRSLDELDGRSDFVYQLASHYFGAVVEPIRGPAQVAKIVRFFHETGMTDPSRHWPRLVWAATRTIHVVKDKEEADRLANDLISLRQYDGTPDWLPLLAERLYRVAENQAAIERLAADPAWRTLKQKALTDFQTVRR